LPLRTIDSPQASIPIFCSTQNRLKSKELSGGFSFASISRLSLAALGVA
jgi:hypothetical protein